MNKRWLHKHHRDQQRHCHTITHIFTPYHVSLNILRWMIGPLFYSKRGIITYYSQRDTEQATLDNIQYKNNWHGGTHHWSVLVDTHDLNPWENQERQRHATITGIPEQLSSEMCNGALNKVKHYICVSPCNGKTVRGMETGGNWAIPPRQGHANGITARLGTMTCRTGANICWLSETRNPTVRVRRWKES